MKKRELYNEDGFLNMSAIMELPVAHIFVVGGRGIGKTYGALEYVVENDIGFLFLRRTQVQIEIVGKPELSPFKTLNRDKGWKIVPAKTSKYTVGFYDSYTENGKMVVDRESFYGYGAALSTFANIRGFDASTVDVIIYDEFIPQINERSMYGEAESFFNMIESINRNRELLGKPPVKVLCFSNSTNCANSIFVYLKIVSRLMKVQKAKEFVYMDVERELCVLLPKDSPISEAKKQTALYKLTKGTDFFNSSIDNEFVYNVPTSVNARPLREYTPIVCVGEVCIYKHKSNGRLYVTEHVSGNPPKYGASEKELTIFRRRYSHFMRYVYQDNIDYETYTCEVLFDKYMMMQYT